MFHVLLHRNNYIYIVYMKLMRNVSYYIGGKNNYHLQNFCVNLFIDLQNELKLSQILSLHPVYLHCYIFHPLYVNGGVLYFM